MFFFFNLWTRYVHHLTKSCKTLQLRLGRHHYSTAQTRENIRIERQASGIFRAIRRPEISCANLHLCESNWTLHFSVTCISKKIYETRTDKCHTAWINPRVPSLGVDTERDFSPSGFFISSNIRSRQNKILLTKYRTGTIYTQGAWMSLLYIERIMLTSFASHLKTAIKCNPWLKLSRSPRKHSTAKKLKNSSVQTQGESAPSTKLANNSSMHTSELQEAR